MLGFALCYFTLPDCIAHTINPKYHTYYIYKTLFTRHSYLKAGISYTYLKPDQQKCFHPLTGNYYWNSTEHLSQGHLTRIHWDCVTLIQVKFKTVKLHWFVRSCASKVAIFEEELMIAVTVQQAHLSPEPHHLGSSLLSL